MGLFNSLRLFTRSDAALTRKQGKRKGGPRRARVEQLEQRQLLAADGFLPEEVLLGGVYFEEATGDDSEGDILQISFVGGAPGTTLDRLVIDGDKLSDGLTSSDIIFDTEAGGLGVFGSAGVSLVSADGFEVTSVSVIDGGSQIIFEFDGFEAGEVFEFSVDVDEVDFMDPRTGDLDLTALAEGGEFQRSKIFGDFSATGYVDLTLEGVYWDDFDGDRDDAEAATGLTLALPNDRYEAVENKIDRSAGAVAHAPQVPLATISGHVYHDRNDDGQYDRDPAAREEPIANVPIELLDESGAVIADTTTDANGYYEFLHLTAGQYTVREAQQPADYLDGKDTAGSHGGVAGDEIIVGALLDFGDHGVEYNFGELLPGSISGLVHATSGPDCDFDNPEILLEDVVIELLDGNGNFLRSTKTDANGQYRFDDLVPGEYRVREIQPSSVNGAKLFDGEERAGSAGGNVSNDLITGINIGSDVHAVDYDFCEHLGAILSGYVYHDVNDDGQFVGEDPISGVTLKLFKDGVDTNQRAVTNSAGYYKFTDLAPGQYTVMEVQPNGWFDGKDTPGSLGGDASTNDRIAEIAIAFGANSTNNNFGELLAGSIAGRVHASLGPDCDFDNPDILLSGVTLQLLDANGNFLRETKTDNEGRYKFDNLEPGDYQVRELQPSGYYDGDEHSGSVGGVVTDDLISDIPIGSDVHAVEYNFCEHVGATLSGYVYHDQSDDGLFDTTEDPIAGVTLQLLNEAGAVVGSTTTNSAGYYEFTNLDAGAYTVIETQPANFFDGKDTAGTTGGDASVNDAISQIVLNYGDNSQLNNFGELLGASIAGQVHASNSPDCDFDNPEILLSGVKIELLDATGAVVAETFTGADGQYKFAGLRPGEYQIRETQPTEYDGSKLFDGGQRAGTAGGVVSNDLVSGIVLGSAENAVNYDFCEHLGAMLSGYVYHDANDDGQFLGEDPIDGVTVKLLKDGVDTGKFAVTDANGFYKFTDLGPGKYTVAETQPTGWYDGQDTPGSLGGDVSVNDKIAEIMLTYGDNSTDNNFGELLGGSIAGQVHVTTDPNCEVDEDDPPIPGVTIELLNEQGEVIATTLTDAEGSYKFDNLKPGYYSVHEIQPEGYFNGGSHVGDGGGSKLHKDLTADILVGSDQHWVHYDFCETPPSQLSGYVFIDGAPIATNEDLTPQQIAELRDGTRTSDDTPLAGVVIHLRNGISGDPIFGVEALPGYYDDGPITTVTDSRGYYEFTGLPGGVYATVQIHPEGLIDGVDTPGSLGGYAVNAPIPSNGQVFLQDLPSAGIQNTIEQFRTRFGNDALVRITVGVGQNSVENNFSEVRKTPKFVPPFETPEIPPQPPVLVGPDIFLPPRLYQPLTPPTVTPDPIFGGSSRALGWTWHLSVVNAGEPRALETNEAEMLMVASTLNSAEWQHAEMDRAEWKLINDDQQAEEIRRIFFGVEEGIPVSGDWDGDGDDEIGVFVAGYWYLDLNGNGRWDHGDLWAQLGSEADLPVTGDWDGDGKTDIGIFGPAWPRDPHAIAREPGLPDADNYPTIIADSTGRPLSKNMPPTLEDATSGARLLRKTIRGVGRADVIDHVFHYGVPGDAPVAGDWNGDGIRTIGVFRDGVWTLDTNGDGRLTEVDQSFQFGAPGDLPAVGDWNGDGVDDLGVFRDGKWVVDTNRNRELDAVDTAFELGDAGDRPIVGDWDGDGVDEPGAYGPHQPTPEFRVSQKAG